MKYKTFTYPIPPPEDLEALNGFISSNNVLSIKPNMVTKGETPYLIFVVEYLGSNNGKNKAMPKIDYREKLSDEDFLFFSRLRDLRKLLADKEGVPVYTIFSNAQLAQIVEQKILDQQELFSINGIGKSKVEKYGDAFIELCKEMFLNHKKSHTGSTS